MKRVLRSWVPWLLAAALLPGLPAPADEAGGDPLPASFTARLRFQVGREHGCSQSFENRAQTGNATLEVLPGGGATLTIDHSEITIFGPSLGSYKQGQRDFSTTREKGRQVWRGKASPSGDQLVIRLHSIASTTIALPEYGDAELPPAVSHRATGSIVCTASTVDAYPAVDDPTLGAWNTEGQSTTPVPALRCVVGDTPDLLAAATDADGGFPLGLAETLLLDGDEMFGDARLVLRKVKPTGEEEAGASGAGE